MSRGDVIGAGTEGDVGVDYDGDICDRDASRLIPKCNNLWLFNFTSILAFYSVLMTFFGVNYFLSGMHSYGQNDNVNGIFIYLYLSIILVLGAGFISYRKRTNFNNIIV